MNSKIGYTILLGTGFIVLFAIAELLYHKKKVRAEVTRKLVHIVSGLAALLFPVLIDDLYLVAILCLTFVFIVWASRKAGLLQSINAVDRVSVGDTLFPLVVLGCYIAYDQYGDYLYFYYPVLILAVSDPIAALVGTRWPKIRYRTGPDSKTLSGSVTFFVSACIIASLLLGTLSDMTGTHIFFVALTTGLLTTASEALVYNGYDNFTVPASALLILIVTNELIL